MLPKTTSGGCGRVAACRAAGVGGTPTRLDRLRALGPEYADFELGGAPGRLGSLASLRRLRTAPTGKVRAALRAEDKDRVREWRAWLEESWSSD